MNKVSVVVITLNEEAKIARCLNSVRKIADEIIVLDSFSTDRTVEIAREFGATVYQDKFYGFTAQKNKVVEFSSNDYVLSLDADEALSETLFNSIKNEKELGFTANAYQMNRLNFYGTKPIKTCGWYPDTKVRLWNKNMAHWVGESVHEKWAFRENYSNSIIKHLAGDLLHYSYSSTEELKKQSDRFASLAAKHLKQQSVFYLILKMLFSPAFKFVRNYFFKLGFTDGAIGFAICRYQSREVFVKYCLALKNKQNP